MTATYSSLPTKGRLQGVRLELLGVEWENGKCGTMDTHTSQADERAQQLHGASTGTWACECLSETDFRILSGI